MQVNYIKGDGFAVNTVKYRNVQQPFRFDNVVCDVNKTPLTYTRWNELVTFFNDYYAMWEINAQTEYDFLCNIRVTYQMNADTFERLLVVYYDDIAMPLLGRTEDHTYDITDTTGNGNTVTEYDNPKDDPTKDAPTGRNVQNGTGTNKRTGSERIELSDLGVRPNYESLNGFLDNNRPYLKVFVDMFKNDFMILDSMYFI